MRPKGPSVGAPRPLNSNGELRLSSIRKTFQRSSTSNPRALRHDHRRGDSRWSCAANSQATLGSVRAALIGEVARHTEKARKSIPETLGNRFHVSLDAAPRSGTSSTPSTTRSSRPPSSSQPPTPREPPPAPTAPPGRRVHLAHRGRDGRPRPGRPAARHPDRPLRVVVCTATADLEDPKGELSPSLKEILPTRTTPLDAPPVPGTPYLSCVDSDGVEDDPRSPADCQALPPAERAALHDARRAELVARSEKSLPRWTTAARRACTRLRWPRWAGPRRSTTRPGPPRRTRWCT